MNPRHPGYAGGVHSYSDLDSQKEHTTAGLPDPQNPPLHPAFEDVRYGTTCNRSEERSDEEIHQELNQEILLNSGSEPMSVQFTVSQGVVTLHGKVKNVQARSLLEERVAACPGIKGISNQIEVRHK